MSLCQTHRYMENFEMALTEFEAAAALWDRGHKVSASIQNVIDQVDKLDNVLKVLCFRSSMGYSLPVLLSPYSIGDRTFGLKII